MATGFFPNSLHGDKWKINFSNIPTISDISEMRYFDNYVKTCNIPPYSVGVIQSQLPDGVQINHPIGGMKKNQDLQNLAISFTVSEDMYNYLVFFVWMQQLRYGQLNPEYEGFYRNYTIDRIVISMLDNQKREIAQLIFTNAFISELSGLDLLYGSTDEMTFTANFVYEEIVYEISDPMVNGTSLQAPTANNCGITGTSINPTLDWNANAL